MLVTQPSDSASEPREAPSGAARHPRLRRLFAGGTDGNEQLTAATGVVLLALLAALGVTILRIGALLNVHMFLGMLLIGPIALKMGSTGYRFVRYYSGSRQYRRKGAPAIELRALAPLVVLSTVAVFTTGVALLITGPSGRGLLTELHKITFIVWVAVTALHVIGHLAELPSALIADHGQRGWDDHGSGRGARAVLLASAIAGGVILAIVTDSQFAAWTHFRRHG
ncbi:MAG: hypothetical protein ACRDLP_08140 [Solirubrobacteraceae bacterium]